MKRAYRMAAAVLVALAGFAAIGTGFLLVAAATVIGALVILAAQLAIGGRTSDQADWPATGTDEERVGN